MMYLITRKRTATPKGGGYNSARTWMNMRRAIVSKQIGAVNGSA